MFISPKVRVPCFTNKTCYNTNMLLTVGWQVSTFRCIINTQGLRFNSAQREEMGQLRIFPSNHFILPSRYHRTWAMLMLCTVSKDHTRQ